MEEIIWHECLKERERERDPIPASDFDNIKLD
jgi:hypothetical protein